MAVAVATTAEAVAAGAVVVEAVVAVAVAAAVAAVVAAVEAAVAVLAVVQVAVATAVVVVAGSSSANQGMDLLKEVMVPHLMRNQEVTALEASLVQLRCKVHRQQQLIVMRT